MRKPDPNRLSDTVIELWGKHQIFTTAPVLGAMEVGQIALGFGTEAAPAAGSDALYYKASKTRINVYSSDGTNIAVRRIT
jgi:hypothetical protein